MYNFSHGLVFVCNVFIEEVLFIVLQLLHSETFWKRNMYKCIILSLLKYQIAKLDSKANFTFDLLLTIRDRKKETN
ncbi:hypothetical protein T11_18158 [Trichinella zimbabwensis]|uniref:Uncharacterized protein n=1 Tax=Trichinella zimbabwensis TaxID=268475 RepID=A0A0V1HUF8_9BILA|nr:hypothetical protein T11_18158 [Trichinella zimbabwensis]